MSELDLKVLKVLYRAKDTATVRDIATKLHIPHSTTGSSIKRLESEGKITYERRGTVNLTEKGIDLAKELLRHTKLIEILLHKSLDLPIEKAHEESEKVNFLFSCETINKICVKYSHPKECPCGDLIPSSRACFCEKQR